MGHEIVKVVMDAGKRASRCCDAELQVHNCDTILERWDSDWAFDLTNTILGYCCP